MLTVEKIREIVTKVGKKYGIKNAYLFGSYAKGTANENSDVDVISEEGMFPGFFDLVKNDRIPLYGV